MYCIFIANFIKKKFIDKNKIFLYDYFNLNKFIKAFLAI
jgi:hypothetical protein